MACLSWAWFENFLITLVIIIFLVAVAKLVIPFLLSLAGAPPGGNIIMTILQYFIWACIAIAVIIFVFNLLSCVLPSATGFLRFPR